MQVISNILNNYIIGNLELNFIRQVAPR